MQKVHAESPLPPATITTMQQLWVQAPYRDASRILITEHFDFEKERQCANPGDSNIKTWKPTGSLLYGKCACRNGCRG